MKTDRGAKKRILDYLKRISEQDNRITAFPYYYVIRDACYIGVKSDNENSDYPSCVDDYDKVEYVDLGIGCYGIDAEEYDALEPEKRERIFMRRYWEEKQIFLTESDANSHLSSNQHHYSKEAHVFTKHAWRCYEFEGFLRDLYSHFKVDSKGMIPKK